MICPKCNEGTIIQIRYKNTGQKASLCEYCDTVWFASEAISITTGHALRSLSEDNDLDYTIDELDEQDQDHRPVESKHDRYARYE